MSQKSTPLSRRGSLMSASIALALVAGLGGAGLFAWTRQPTVPQPIAAESAATSQLTARKRVDTSGYAVIVPTLPSWAPDAPLKEVGQAWQGATDRIITELDRQLQQNQGDWGQEVSILTTKASCLMYAGKPGEAYRVLETARQNAENRGGQARAWSLSTLMYFQGVASLRRGENENCIMCRGDSSCILPISATAVHKNPEGSQQAVERFTEYLNHFPDDLSAKWLLNVAHMTLGEHPDKVDPRFLIRLDKWCDESASIGRFRDIGHLTGVNRFNQAGGALMEDLNNDGLFDLVATSFDCQQPISVYRNLGDGQFADEAEAGGIQDQLGGLNCIQTDYNNDGLLDLYVPRGAWISRPIRPSLLRNDGNLHFTDVTEEAGLLYPVCSNAAQWADFDNDGWLDLFVCSERGHNLLFHNLQNGKFEEVGLKAGVSMDGQNFTKGCNWIDYDNDNFQDLFINFLDGTAQLYHNDRDGHFTNVTRKMGIDGPYCGFSCWAWDFDNDGWQDIFATCYERTLDGVVLGLMGEPHQMRSSNKLYRNLEGKGFRDVAKEVGLDMVFATMGSNYSDFDNDGYLDMYLGTGEPDLSTLIPNRMFRNLGGSKFAEITRSAGVGHLQKGHGIACGDWDRDGNVDIFAQTGGAVDGDKYHNLLFQNPGHDGSWLSVKLVGQQTNRAAIGARIKVVTEGETPLTVHRHVSSGSSFGSNPLEQTIGLAGAKRIAELEIHWPTSGTTQVFRDIDVNQIVEITEQSAELRIRTVQRVPVPQ